MPKVPRFWGTCQNSLCGKQFLYYRPADGDHSATFCSVSCRATARTQRPPTAKEAQALAKLAENSRTRDRSKDRRPAPLWWSAWILMWTAVGLAVAWHSGPRQNDLGGPELEQKLREMLRPRVPLVWDEVGR